MNTHRLLKDGELWGGSPTPDDGRSQDVRDAVRVARLVQTLGVDKAVSLLLPAGWGDTRTLAISNPPANS